MIKFMFITNCPKLALYAEKAGVQRIFIDLERIGKQERQGHLDTLISNHQMSDIATVRKVLRKSELLVRLNPLHAGSKEEVEGSIRSGADVVMLPMFRSVAEVLEISQMIGSRAKFIPLIETVDAFRDYEQVASVPGVTELYFGLNDLHMDMGMTFMFEPLASGMLDPVAACLNRRNIPFGFGGIARLDEGLVSGGLVLAEHCRLGSTAVILSRTFHRGAVTQEELDGGIDFAGELAKLRLHERQMMGRTESQVSRMNAEFKNNTALVVDKKRTTV